MDEFERDLLLAKIQGSRNELDEKAHKLGLHQMWAYRCMRCNYVWFPRDFDPMSMDGNELVQREPPKSCARCKSKQWNDLHRRYTKTYDNDFIDSVGLPRLRALHRQGKLGYKIEGCECQYCKV
jgi:hypothetical protein